MSIAQEVVEIRQEIAQSRPGRSLTEEGQIAVSEGSKLQ